MPESPGGADVAVAHFLFTIWATRTGRELRPVPVPELTPDELIAFWDDYEPEHILGAEHA